MIPVTKPFLPPLEEYQELVQGIWNRNWLTNDGPLVQELENKLKEYLRIEHLHYTSNGTIAIQLALKALNITKEVITTPFSYVATTSSLVWEGCTPIYADIDKETLNIDPLKIEECITPKTEAILATHCFGNPCDIESIDIIAKKYNLKVIYDAAHCFGTIYKGRSIFTYGDISITSFHATKIFHSVEGGAIFSNKAKIANKIFYLRNFGHDGFDKYNGIGINGKNSEFHAAMGILNLKYIDNILEKRKELSKNYDYLIKGLNISKQKLLPKSNYNYAYYPVLFKNQEITLTIKAALEQNEIYPRRYFFPSLNQLEYVRDQLSPITDDISSRILCLPLYHDLSKIEQNLVIQTLLNNKLQ